MKNLVLISLTALAMLTCSAQTDLRIVQIELIPFGCTSDNTPATVTVTAAGGSGQYTFKMDGGSEQESNVFPDIDVEGEHPFTVIDGKGDEATATVDVGPAEFTSVIVRQDPWCEDRKNFAKISFITEVETTSPNVRNVLDDNLGTAIDELSGTFEEQVEGGTDHTVESINLGSTDCDPGDTTKITLNIVLPQPTGNGIQDFITEKICAPCVA